MKLEEHETVSSCGQYARKIWYLPCSGPAERIGIFLDGEHYLDQMHAPTLLVRLQHEKLIPAMSCVFVSHGDGAARQEDYICNSRYAQFVVEDVLPWVKTRGNVVSPGGHFIGGLSLSGLASGFLALTYPSLFQFTLCQSGSFWWNKEWLAAQSFNQATGKRKYWISVGNQETDSGISHPPSGLRQDVDQISACSRFAQTLEARGDLVHYHLFDGGHEGKPWKQELSDALHWLLA